MKKRKTYEEEAKKLAKAIDIAIEAIRKYCPSEFDKSHQEHFISCYSDWKTEYLNPEPQFKTLGSLKYSIQDVFTYFQEGTGLTVEYFWKRIKEERLDYKRENKLEKILSRGKIKGRIEYEYVTDMIVAAEQVGMTTRAETEKLSKMLGEFESKMRE